MNLIKNLLPIFYVTEITVIFFFFYLIICAVGFISGEKKGAPQRMLGCSLGCLHCANEVSSGRGKALALSSIEFLHCNNPLGIV